MREWNWEGDICVYVYDYVEIYGDFYIEREEVLVFDSLSGGTVVGLDKRRSSVIRVIVFGHRSDIYIYMYVHALLPFS